MARDGAWGSPRRTVALVTARAAVLTATGGGVAAGLGGIWGSATAVTCSWFVLFGAALGLLLAASPPSAWLVAAAVLLPAGWGDAVATAAAAVLLAAAYVRIARPTIEVGPAAAIAAPLAAVRLVWPEATGATAALATGVLVMAALTGLRALDPVVRRAMLLASGAVAGFAVAAAVGGIVNGLAEVGRLDRAVDAVEAGLDATRAGDAERGGVLLSGAAASFRDIGRAFDAPWAAPARAVPILGRQLDASAALVDAAARLASIGADVAVTVDTERLRPVDGRVDLGAIAALQAPLRRVEVGLDDVLSELRSLGSPWLAPPLAEAIDEFDTRARDAERDVRAALRALDVAPDLLGAAGERRWIVAIVTPAQTRGAGGYMGSYGVIRVVDGDIELEHLGRHDELSVPTGPLGPPEYVDRYWANFGLDRFAGNLPASPHFPSVATALAAKYRAITGEAVDGAIAVDPDAFAALLGLVGPVSVPEWPEPIGVDNARRVLLHDQYVALSQDTDNRVDFLEAVAREVFDRMTSGGLPEPADVGAAMSPMLAGRRLQLWSTRPDEQAWFEEIGASGSLAPLRDDALAVVLNNASRSKIDWYLRRDIAYDVAADGSAVLRVRFHNAAPTSGVPPYIIGPAPDGAPSAGVNHTFVSLFSPRTPTMVTVDGLPVVFSVGAEQGRQVAETFVDVPPGGVAELRVQFEGAPPTAGYRIDLHGQPMINPDQVRVTVDGEVLFDGPQTTDLVLRRR